MLSNTAAKTLLSMVGRGNLYPGGVEDFSQLIANDLYRRIAQQVAEGGTGVLRDQDIYDLAKDQWRRYGVGDCFPGNVREGYLSAPWCSLLAVIAGALANRGPFDTVEPILAPSIPPGGTRVTTSSGHATYIVDGDQKVVPGSVQRSTIAPRPFEFAAPRPDQHGDLDHSDRALQAAFAVPYTQAAAYPLGGFLEGTPPASSSFPAPFALMPNGRTIDQARFGFANAGAVPGPGILPLTGGRFGSATPPWASFLAPLAPAPALSNADASIPADRVQPQPRQAPSSVEDQVPPALRPLLRLFPEGWNPNAG